ncbi:HIT family protein [Pullulanibacillus sp. KACC 23026]|uniref:HIT family protein n=1 Tax=Pullulanibacillus sp. KACC 23026 TaxID=3028315 RepID=UPI0023AECF7A|nr:HIT family protein [Pullulanibacillus sp. KACC 23026]WEG12027.1 HIT family protein [Pullulanibacillus sp. KACC 23026]
MAHDSTCIFCKIIQGEIPAAKVFENEHVIAFLDIGQVTKGHTLVIPKDHQANIFELQEDTAAKLFAAVPQIARAIKQAFQPVGLNLLNNNGELAGQSVFHYHVHLIPRYGEGDGFGAVWKTNDVTPEARTEIAQKIADAL